MEKMLCPRCEFVVDDSMDYCYSCGLFFGWDDEGYPLELRRRVPKYEYYKDVVKDWIARFKK